MPRKAAVFLFKLLVERWGELAARRGRTGAEPAELQKKICVFPIPVIE